MQQRTRATALFSLLVLAACGLATGQAQTTSTNQPPTSESNPASSTPVTNTVTNDETTTKPLLTTTTAPDTGSIATTAPVFPHGLTPVIDGHNNLDADRINLVFASWGWDDLDLFGSVLDLYLGWNGRAQLIDIDGQPTTDPEQAVRAELGLFGIEPFRSTKTRFNLWVTDRQPSGPADWIDPAADPFTLPDHTTIVLALDPEAEIPDVRSIAGQNYLFRPGTENPGQLQRRSDDPFANIMIAVNSQSPATAALDLPHELGHALFGLADEYVGRRNPDEEPRSDFWPSCAASKATAESWWGDLIGQHDPMIDIWYDEMTAVGFGDRIANRSYYQQLVTTDYIETGCFGVPGSIRSAQDTLMGFNTPAYGLTNRRRAEHIINLWSG